MYPPFHVQRRILSVKRKLSIMSGSNMPGLNMSAPNPSRLTSYRGLLFLALTSLAPGQPSSAAQSTAHSAPSTDSLTLSNQAISATWSVRGGALRWHSLTNHFTGATLSLDGSVFELVPKEGPVLRSADLKIVSAPILRNLPGSPYQAQVNSPRSDAPKADAPPADAAKGGCIGGERTK